MSKSIRHLIVGSAVSLATSASGMTTRNNPSSKCIALAFAPTMAQDSILQYQQRGPLRSGRKNRGCTLNAEHRASNCVPRHGRCRKGPVFRGPLSWSASPSARGLPGHWMSPAYLTHPEGVLGRELHHASVCAVAARAGTSRAFASRTPASKMLPSCWTDASQRRKIKERHIR